jgi:hypothetical protein
VQKCKTAKASSLNLIDNKIGNYKTAFKKCSPEREQVVRDRFGPRGWSPASATSSPSSSSSPDPPCPSFDSRPTSKLDFYERQDRRNVYHSKIIIKLFFQIIFIKDSLKKT